LPILQCCEIAAIVLHPDKKGLLDRENNIQG
jgi:hypothetical protein